jgi:hypothetical protein
MCSRLCGPDALVYASGFDPLVKKTGRYPAFSSTDKQNLDLNVNCSTIFLGVFLAGMVHGSDVYAIG